jgi:predicted Fe-Mo cluster-binding NifX family protein
MKLCLPTIGNKGMDEMVFNHFGSAKYFTIYDTDSKSVKIVKNTNQHHNHGACQPLGVISNHDVNIVLTNGMGKRAVELLNNGGVKVLLLQGNTVKEAIQKFENNELIELTPLNACGGHGHGNGCH